MFFPTHQTYLAIFPNKFVTGSFSVTLVFTKRFLHFFQLWGIWTVRSSDHVVQTNIPHLGTEDGHLLSTAALSDGLDFVRNGEFGLFTPRTAHTEDLQVGLSKQIFWKWCHSNDRNNADNIYIMIIIILVIMIIIMAIIIIILIIFITSISSSSSSLLLLFLLLYKQSLENYNYSDAAMLLIITRAWKATSLKMQSYFSCGQNLQALIG